MEDLSGVYNAATAPTDGDDGDDFDNSAAVEFSRSRRPDAACFTASTFNISRVSLYNQASN